MSTFEVWAPAAGRVELVTPAAGGAGEERRPMERADGGWWRLDAPDLGDGADYAFALDGGPPRPDPRSRWQPDGVHGFSRVVDPPWSERTRRRGEEPGGAWRGFHLPSAVLYELHVGTFTPEGTFAAAAERLDHLVSLGVTAVSLMPVNAFAGRHGWGYDGVGLWAVHEPYGGPAGLTAFVDACHARGLGVVLDVVYNHLGPSGNYLAEFGPYFREGPAAQWGSAPNLDGPGSDEVRRFFLDNARAWLRDYGLDGLRLDAVHAIVDGSAVHLLEELAEEVDALAAAEGRPLWLIAESDLNDPRLLWSRERGGYGLHAQWSDDFHHALHAAITGEDSGYYADFGRLGDIADALRGVFVYDGRHSAHRGRRHGRPAGDLPGYRFLGYLQNHDQVGNRAAGERIGQLAGTDLQKAAAALVLLSPFVPMLFQGEEWAATTPFQYFTDHAEPELAAAVREGRRSEFAAFGWKPEEVADPQAAGTFRGSVLRWEERSRPEHADVERWYRDLLALRRARPALSDGRRDAVEVDVDEEARTVVMRRGDVVVCCNLGDAQRTVPAGCVRPEILMSSREGAAIDSAGVRLPPRSAVILACPPEPHPGASPGASRGP